MIQTPAVVARRGRKRAPLDPEILQTIGNAEVHGTPVGSHDDRLDYGYGRYLKPETLSSDRARPRLSALREMTLAGGYQLCEACGEAILNDDACVVAPVLMTGGKCWFLYLHPGCSASKAWLASKVYRAMWAMEQPFHTTSPAQMTDSMHRKLVSGLLPLYGRREVRLKLDKGRWREVDDGPYPTGAYVSNQAILIFVPFSHPAVTRISFFDRKVRVYEQNGFVTLVDPHYWDAQFRIMGLHPDLRDPVSDREFQADEFKLNRAMLKRAGGGGRQTGTGGHYDPNNTDDGSDCPERPARPYAAMMAKPSHPVFRNRVESEYILRLAHFGELAPDARIWSGACKDLWPIVTFDENKHGKHVPVLAEGDQRTRYRHKRVNRAEADEQVLQRELDYLLQAEKEDDRCEGEALEENRMRQEELRDAIRGSQPDQVLRKERGQKPGLAVHEWDASGHPAEYAFWSDRVPYAPPEALQDGWHGYRPRRDDFRTYCTEIWPAFRCPLEFDWHPVRDYEWESSGLAELERKLNRRITFRLPDSLPKHIPIPRPVDVLKRMQVGNIAAVYAGGAPVLGGVPVESMSKLPAPRPVSVRAGREHLERILAPKWLPGQIKETRNPHSPLCRTSTPPLAA